MMNSQGVTNVINPALQKMMKADNSMLSLRYVKDKKSVEGLAEFLERESVRILNFVEPAHVSIFIHVLEELSRVNNRIEALHIDLWSNGAPELVPLLAKAFRANSESLLEISFKCRVGAKFVADLLPFIPTNVEILDLSENILSDAVFLEPLMDFIRCSELHILRMVNCSIRAEVLDKFVSLLNSNHCPISLEAMEGLDLGSCEDVPKVIRSTLKEPPAKTRKDLMGYGCLGPLPIREGAVQYLDYLKSSLLMHRLVGCRVRVWWPATSEESRSGFAGRFWPAKVLRVNPIDMIFVVEYDNQEVDRVPCKFIQPEAPFMYGGGLNENFLKSMFGMEYFAALSNELSARPPPQMNVFTSMPSGNLSAEHVTSMIPTAIDGINPIALPMEHGIGICPPMDRAEPGAYCCAPATTPWPIQIQNTVSGLPAINGRLTRVTFNDSIGAMPPRAQLMANDPLASGSIPSVNVPSLSSSKSKKRIPTGGVPYEDKMNTPLTGKRPHSYDTNVQNDVSHKTNVPKGKSTAKSHGMSSKKVKIEKETGERQKQYDFITKMFSELTMSSNRRGCDVFYPTDLKHLATDCRTNVETMVGLDVSLSGNVLEPGDVCEFRDPLDTDGSDPSDYIGVIKEVNSKEPLYKVICVYQDDEEVVEMDSIDVRRLTMIPWHLWVSLVMAVERHALLCKRLSEPDQFYETLSECLYCVKKRDPLQPFKGTPPNPLEMPVQLITEFAKEIKPFSQIHSRLAMAQSQRSGDPDSLEGLKYQVRKQQQKIETLLEIYEAVRIELEKERDLNIELQAKLNCVVCFEKRINCLLNPCGHFNFCKSCADNFSNCPICRRRIIRRQVLCVD